MYIYVVRIVINDFYNFFFRIKWQSSSIAPTQLVYPSEISATTSPVSGTIDEQKNESCTCKIQKIMDRLT